MTTVVLSWVLHLPFQDRLSFTFGISIATRQLDFCRSLVGDLSPFPWLDQTSSSVKPWDGWPACLVPSSKTLGPNGTLHTFVPFSFFLVGDVLPLSCGHFLTVVSSFLHLLTTSLTPSSGFLASVGAHGFPNPNERSQIRLDSVSVWNGLSVQCWKTISFNLSCNGRSIP